MSELGALLGETAARVFDRASSGSAFDAPLWSAIVETGLHRVLLPEDQGGSGSLEHAVAVATQFGARPGAVPFVETLLGNWLLSQAGSAPSDAPLALGFGNADHLVPWPNAVRRLLILNEQTLSDVRVQGDAQKRTLGGEPAATVGAGSTAIHLPSAAGQSEAFAGYALLKAAAIAGALDAVLDMTIEYANTRTQFGRSIGKFQAVQMMIAEISAETAAVATAVQYAARAFETSRDQGAVAIAKGFASEAAGLVAVRAHQVHGAIGFTEEFALQRFTRRLWMWRDDGGSESTWHALVGHAALRAGEHGLWPAITGGFAL